MFVDVRLANDVDAHSVLILIGQLEIENKGPSLYMPSAPHEVFHLKVHPNVIQCCMEDLFDVGCARHVARISRRKAIIHKAKVTPVERVVFRFFMLTKEVQNIASKLNVKNAIALDD